ncbi:MAG: hypothetical protein PHZ19_07620 [Candidatus Thermoplasmatota archaeon]|nr:hypothetical protein [Candidatus Thermoplasmatota archaeon]
MSSPEEVTLLKKIYGKKDYNELSGTQLGAQTDKEYDLGQEFKDVTVFVDKPVTVKFHTTEDNVITLSSEGGRVGTPVFFRGIKARYVFLTTTVDTYYIITGNG